MYKFSIISWVKFSINKMGKSGALFDLDKLNDISKNELAKLSETEIRTMTAYEVSVSKLAAFDSTDEFDIDSEFDLYSLQGKSPSIIANAE